MIVLLIRHGQTEHTSSGRYLGAEDVPLDATGRLQAEALAPVIARFAPDAAICSPQRRARETLALMAPEGPESIVDERLREVDFGSWEGLRTGDVAALDPDGKAAFDSGDMNRLPGGEDVDDVALRVAEAVSGAAGAGSRLLVVSHNTALRLGITQLLGLPTKRYRVTLDTLRPCHWAEMDLGHASGPRLVTYNSIRLADR